MGKKNKNVKLNARHQMAEKFGFQNIILELKDTVYWNWKCSRNV